MKKVRTNVDEISKADSAPKKQRGRPPSVDEISKADSAPKKQGGRPSVDEISKSDSAPKKQRGRPKVKHISKPNKLEQSSSNDQNNSPEVVKRHKKTRDIKETAQVETCDPINSKEKKIEEKKQKKGLKNVAKAPPLTLIKCFQGEEQHSILSRQILCDFPDHTRTVMLSIICFAFYYSGHKRRTPLFRLWGNKPQISRLDKLCKSIRPWLDPLGLHGDKTQDKLIESVRALFTCLWENKR